MSQKWSQKRSRKCPPKDPQIFRKSRFPPFFSKKTTNLWFFVEKVGILKFQMMICPLQWTISTKSLVFTNFYKNVDFLQDLCKRQEKQTSDTRRELDLHSNFRSFIFLVFLKILLLDFEIRNGDLSIIVSELMLFLQDFYKNINFLQDFRKQQQTESADAGRELDLPMNLSENIQQQK